jgi:hypothetical protein
MKTFLLNTSWRGLNRGTSRAWLVLVFLSAVGQIMAESTAPITNPTNNATSHVGSTVVFGADGSHGDHSVTNAGFYRDFPVVGAVSNSPYQLTLTSDLPATQVTTEAEAKPAPSYSPRLELGAPQANSVQSDKYPGVEYSGILVQALRSNPLQLINPFAPAKYGDGEANILRHLRTREVEGLKLWQISF